MALPKWVTPDRQAYLVRLFIDSKGFCVFGHKSCAIPEHHYSFFVDTLISDWVNDDRVQRQAEWQAERKRLHRLSDRQYPIRGQFNAVSKDLYYDNQPQFYLEGIAVSGLTYRPFVKVRLSSSYSHLYIDLGDILRSMSKSKRRKVIRYGMALPIDIQRQVDKTCNLAVRHYLEH